MIFAMTGLPDLKKIKIPTDKIENDLTGEKNIKLSILRLDKIHPEVSGNKFFKLYYYLQKAIQENKPIITFGGAYSNHLSATATACKLAGIECIGIVRGDKPTSLSSTLTFCIKQGMKLDFISREKYRSLSAKDFDSVLLHNYGEHILIPEGGYGSNGVKGAELISQFYQEENYNYICCPVGSGTTLAGIINSSDSMVRIIGFSALKILDDFPERMNFLINKNVKTNYHLNNNYHFSGYARKSDLLINFMNKFYYDFNIPTDFVYTGKMMFGVFDLIEKNYFKRGSNLLCMHTGGLQGNKSLIAGTLNF